MQFYQNNCVSSKYSFKTRQRSTATRHAYDLMSDGYTDYNWTSLKYFCKLPKVGTPSRHNHQFSGGNILHACTVPWIVISYLKNNTVCKASHHTQYTQLVSRYHQLQYFYWVFQHFDWSHASCSKTCFSKHQTFLSPGLVAMQLPPRTLSRLQISSVISPSIGVPSTRFSRFSFTTPY